MVQTVQGTCLQQHWLWQRCFHKQTSAHSTGSLASPTSLRTHNGCRKAINMCICRMDDGHAVAFTARLCEGVCLSPSMKTSSKMLTTVMVYTLLAYAS